MDSEIVLDSKISPIMLHNWIQHPITRRFLALSTELLETNKQELAELLINIPSLHNLDLHRVAQIRGQIYTLEKIIDLKEYLSELMETE